MTQTAPIPKSGTPPEHKAPKAPNVKLDKKTPQERYRKAAATTVLTGLQGVTKVLTANSLDTALCAAHQTLSDLCKGTLATAFEFANQFKTTQIITTQTALSLILGENSFHNEDIKGALEEDADTLRKTAESQLVSCTPLSGTPEFETLSDQQKIILTGLHFIKLSSSPKKIFSAITLILRAAGYENSSTGLQVLKMIQQLSKLSTYEAIATIGGAQTLKSILQSTIDNLFSEPRSDTEAAEQKKNKTFLNLVINEILGIALENSTSRQPAQPETSTSVSGTPHEQDLSICKQTLEEYREKFKQLIKHLPTAATALGLALNPKLARTPLLLHQVTATELQGSCEAPDLKGTKTLPSLLDSFSKGSKTVEVKGETLKGGIPGDSDPEPDEMEGLRTVDGKAAVYKTGAYRTQFGTCLLKHAQKHLPDGVKVTPVPSSPVFSEEGYLLNESPVIELGDRRPPAVGREEMLAVLASQVVPGVHGGDIFWGEKELRVLDLEGMDFSAEFTATFLHKTRQYLLMFEKTNSEEQLTDTLTEAACFFETLAADVEDDKVDGINDLIKHLDGITVELLEDETIASHLIRAIDKDNKLEGRFTDAEKSIQKLKELLKGQSIGELIKQQIAKRYRLIADCLNKAVRDESNNNLLQKVARTAYVASLKEGQDSLNAETVRQLKDPGQASHLSGNYKSTRKQGMTNPWHVLMLIISESEKLNRRS